MENQFNTVEVKETEYLVFKKIKSKSGKTYDVSIENKKGEFLGLIHWFGPFRKYTFHTIGDVELDDICMDDISTYSKLLMKERKRIPL